MDYLKLEGTTLDRYEVMQQLNEEGRIIAVYQAFQPSLKRSVAVQVLNPNLPLNFRQAFLRGSEIIARLEHPNIVPIHDCGTQGELTFAVVRLLTGCTLRKRLQNGLLPVQQAAPILKQVSGALEYIHSRGLAHGDPSVSNIMFDEWGNAYMADFVVAGILAEIGGNSGTPVYMSPERWNKQKPNAATDQYALGCIMYQAISGHPPFEGTLEAIAYKHFNEVVPPPQAYNPEISIAVNDVLFRALAKKPEDRYPTVMDFAREFEKALQAVPQHVFISYSRHDKDYARQLADHLSVNGFTVWIDDQIDYGDAWFKEIDGAVKSCAAFSLLMSPDAEQSEWVHKEILLAKRYKKPIFPLLLAGDEFPIVIDIQFADVKDGSMPDTDFHRRLRRAVFGEG